jgi:hypothetical protein
MKVYIGPYKSWIGPYQIAEKLMFWADKYDDSVHRLGDWLDKVPGLSRFCLWIEGLRKQTIYIKIDKWDTWSMDHTLAMIVLPMLKQLQATKHGSPLVDLEDVPEHLRIVGHEDWSSQRQLQFDDQEQYEKDSWEMTHRRWEWVLNEMIFAFECKLNEDWDEEFWSGEWGESKFEETGEEHFNSLTNKMEKLYTMHNTGNRTCDWEARQKVQDRINNGFRLFGKYYEGLWD